MIYNDIISKSTPTECVSINYNELIARLGYQTNLNDDSIKNYLKIFNEYVRYRYAYTMVPIKIVGDICYFENEKIKSSSVAKIMQGYNNVILLSVTTGIEIDKLINKTSIQNPSGTYYIDAIASAAVESYIDYVNAVICEGFSTSKRFSPGYADFPIEFQYYLLNRLSAKETIGVMLSNDYLMIPTKSITAIIGVK